jgi:hypothetical protein
MIRRRRIREVKKRKKRINKGYSLLMDGSATVFRDNISCSGCNGALILQTKLVGNG